MKSRENSAPTTWGHFWGHLEEVVPQNLYSARVEPFNTKDTVSARNNDKKPPLREAFFVVSDGDGGIRRLAPTGARLSESPICNRFAMARREALAPKAQFSAGNLSFGYGATASRHRRVVLGGKAEPAAGTYRWGHVAPPVRRSSR